MCSNFFNTAVDAVLCRGNPGTTWTSFWTWSPGEELRSHYPPRHSDFRDSTPPQLADVPPQYSQYIRQGRWTFGLFDMWCPREKYVKHATHIPCWDSFRWLPWRWRGIVLGRSPQACYWFGLRQTRWARMVYAANLGREYIMPVRGVGRHGYKSEIKALCWLYFLMGFVFSCGIGQIFSLCGNVMFNCSAWYSCHAREKIRRRYGLPPSVGCPSGVDDFLVHFFCFYCAVYQETRELAIRGVDGPGMHPFDLLPDSYAHAPGAAEAIAARKAVVDRMLAAPPRMFRSRRPQRDTLTMEDAQEGAALTLHHVKTALGFSDTASMDGSETSSIAPFGWGEYSPPQQQEMMRGASVAAPVGLTRSQSLPYIRIEAEGDMAYEEPGNHKLTRSWSIVY